MTFRPAIQVLCLLLMLSVQFLAAHHASVHPVEMSHAQSSHSIDHQSDHDDDGCGLCDFIKAVSHSINNTPPVILLAMIATFFAYNGMKNTARLQYLRVASYFPQAPPVSLS